MKRFSLLSLFIIVSLVLVPLAALAQDDDEEWQEFTSEDGKLTVSYPPDWVAQEPGEFFPFAGVYIAGSEETMEKLNSEEDIPPVSGEVGIIVLLMPTAFLGMMGTEFPEDVTTEELTTTIANMFYSSEEGAGETPETTTEDDQATPEATEAAEAPMESIELGEYQEIDLGEEVMAGLITTTGGDEEGAMIVREIQEDLVLIVVGLTFPGEYDEDLQDIFTRIAGSVEYTGTAEEIMSTMMAPPDVETTTLDGETLINDRCTGCHTRERIDQADKDEEGWTETVDRMIAYGAVLSAEERDALIEYLVETH